MKPLTNMELSSFCEQMALILKSGISASEGLDLMSEDASQQEEKEILKALSEEMMMTGYLATALKSTSLFPPYMIHMIQIGEETGNLDDVMEALCIHYEREEEIAQRLKSSITYPMIMIGMMVAVIVLLLVKVLPIFNQVFVQLGTELTGISKGLLNLGALISRYSILCVVLLILLIGVGFYMMKHPSGQKLARNIGYKLSFTRKIFEEQAACRFSSGMALTLSSGLHPDRSLELVEAITEDEHFKEKMDKCKALLSEGADISTAFHQAHILEGTYARMASIGEKTGSLDKVMNDIANLYQNSIDTKIGNLLAVIEPTFVIALSLIVGVILFSVMLPLMGIMSSI